MEKYLFILKGCPFFSGMTDQEILSIMHCMRAQVKEVARNAYIFRAGESTETMGLVLHGSVLVIQEDLWGHRNILAKVLPGDFFGESYAATPGSVLNVSVVANEDSEILLLNVQFLHPPQSFDPESGFRAGRKGSPMGQQNHPHQQAQHPGKAFILPVRRVHPPRQAGF